MSPALCVALQAPPHAGAIAAGLLAAAFAVQAGPPAIPAGPPAIPAGRPAIPAGPAPAGVLEGAAGAAADAVDNAQDNAQQVGVALVLAGFQLLLCINQKGQWPHVGVRSYWLLRSTSMAWLLQLLLGFTPKQAVAVLGAIRSVWGRHT